jgi:tetratricopeptide (TPR) repeat protein
LTRVGKEDVEVTKAERKKIQRWEREARERAGQTRDLELAVPGECCHQCFELYLTFGATVLVDISATAAAKSSNAVLFQGSAKGNNPFSHNEETMAPMHRKDDVALPVPDLTRVLSINSREMNPFAPAMPMEQSFDAQEVEFENFWDAANICHSPKLNTYFDAKRIDETLPFYLPYRSVTQETPEFISGNDLRSLKSAPREEAIAEKGIVKSRSPSNGRVQQAASFFERWLEKSLGNIYVLDPLPKSPKRPKPIITIPKSSLPMSLQISACKNRLRKLEKVSSRDNAGVISEVKRLADLCYKATQMIEAEHLYIQVAMAKQRTLGKEHYDTVSVYLDVADAHSDAGDPAGAEELFRSMFPEIVRLFGRTCDLAMRCLSELGVARLNAGEYKEAERLAREGLQLSLSTYGMRHPSTAKFLFDIAVTLLVPSRVLMLRDSEEVELAATLIKDSLDIETGLDTLPESTRLYRMQFIARSLHQRREHDECIRLDKEILLRSRNLYGAEHGGNFRSLHRLTTSLRDTGRLVESEASVGYMIRLETDFSRFEHKKELVENLVGYLNELGKTLECMELHREAAARFEEVQGHCGYKCIAAVPTHKDSEVRAHLRSCYTAQGMYTEEEAFETRLQWLSDNGVYTTYPNERSRSWDRYNFGEDLDEIEQHVVKKVRLQPEEEDRLKVANTVEH